MAQHRTVTNTTAPSSDGQNRRAEASLYTHHLPEELVEAADDDASATEVNGKKGGLSGGFGCKHESRLTTTTDTTAAKTFVKWVNTLCNSYQPPMHDSSILPSYKYPAKPSCPRHPFADSISIILIHTK
jgi:hypothetical protein